MQRPKVSVYIATSLDGYIARKDGALDWLEPADQTNPADEDYGYKAFFNSVDCLILGSHSFEKVLTFPSWPYEDKRVIVLSSRSLRIPAPLTAKVKPSNLDPQTLLKKLHDEGIKHVYIDGGKLIQSFLKAGLVDELTLTLIPVLLGSGIPLFGTLTKDIALNLQNSAAFPSGFVQNHYLLQHERWP